MAITKVEPRVQQIRETASALRDGKEYDRIKTVVFTQADSELLMNGRRMSGVFPGQRVSQVMSQVGLTYLSAYADGVGVERETVRAGAKNAQPWEYAGDIGPNWGRDEARGLVTSPGGILVVTFETVYRNALSVAMGASASHLITNSSPECEQFIQVASNAVGKENLPRYFDLVDYVTHTDIQGLGVGSQTLQKLELVAKQTNEGVILWTINVPRVAGEPASQAERTYLAQGYKAVGTSTGPEWERDGTFAIEQPDKTRLVFAKSFDKAKHDALVSIAR